MKRILVITVLLIFGALAPRVAHTQNSFFYSQGKRIPLALSDTEVTVRFRVGVSSSEIQALRSAEPSLGEFSSFGSASCREFVSVKVKPNTNINQLVDRLRTKLAIESVNPVYLINGKSKFQVLDRFVLKFLPSVQKADIDALNSLHHVEVVSNRDVSPNVYILRVARASDFAVLDMANLYHDDTRVVYSIPEYLADIRLWSTPNDTYFQNQYYLRNTGQTGGVSGVDINVAPAWDLTTGSSSITVAVIDEGGMVHEDLPASRIVTGWNAVDQNYDPSAGGNEGHGMTCAGIIWSDPTISRIWSVVWTILSNAPGGLIKGRGIFSTFLGTCVHMRTSKFMYLRTGVGGWIGN